MQALLWFWQPDLTGLILLGVKNNRVKADASASPANASLISNFAARVDKLGSSIASAQQARQMLNINENKEFEYVG